jgi:YVTN family beta-propeller protein
MRTRCSGRFVAVVVGGLLALASPAQAAHPSGSHVYLGNASANSLSVVEPATSPVVGNVTLGLQPAGRAVHPDGTRVDVVKNESSDVSVMDTASLSVVAVAVGQRPIGVALDPAGGRVYVTHAMSNTVTVLQAATDAIAATIPVGVGPRGVAVHRAGSHVYAATGSGVISGIDTVTHDVTNVTIAPGLYGIAVTPPGGDVYVVSQEAGADFVVDTPAPCDSTALEQALAATQAQASALQTTNQALGAENGRLQSDRAAVRATIVSFVRMLFGERVDENVAGAVRAVALAELTAARAVTPRSWRVQHAQGSFDQGDKAMRGRDWRRAVREYREAGAIVQRIRGERHRTAEVPASVVTEPAPAAPATLPSTTGACDTTPLEQAVAATERRIASLQAASQALTTNNARLRAELAAARSGITSFVRRLFGEGTDANVAAAARDASLAELTAAHEAASHDRRLRLAQHSFDHGQHAMRKHDWGRAVHEFRETHELCERILRDKARSPARPVTSD